MNTHSLLAGGLWAAGASAGIFSLRWSAHQQPIQARGHELSDIEQRLLNWVLSGHGKAVGTVTKHLALYTTQPTAAGSH